MRPVLSLRGQNDISKMISLANRAKSAGFWGVGLNEELEDCNGDVFLTVGALTQKCPGLGVMTDVVNQHSRHPVALANAAVSTANSTRGLFILGVGSGSPATSRALNLSNTRALARLREVIEIIRLLSSDNENANFDGEFFKLKGLHSIKEERYKFPIFIPGIQDRTIKFAARYGDGIVLSNLSSVSYAKHAAKIIREFQSNPDFQIACNVTCVPSNDLSEGLKIAKRFVERYLSFPIIGETLLEKSGFDQKIALEVRSGNFDRVTSDLVQSMIAVGDSDHLLDRLHELEKQGVSTLVIGTDSTMVDKLLAINLDSL